MCESVRNYTATAGAPSDVSKDDGATPASADPIAGADRDCIVAKVVANCGAAEGVPMLAG